MLAPTAQNRQYEIPLPAPIGALLVTDDDRTAIDLRRLLHGAGFAVCGVTQSTRGALARIARNRPQLVLIDLDSSAALDGIDLAMRMRAQHDAAIVFLAGHARMALLERVLAVAPDGYVVKPCSAQSLIATSHLAIQHRAQQSQLEAEKARFEREAVLDPLTGLFNRRAFTAAVAREVELAHRKGTWLGCLVIDLDRFKTINDTYGHALGDRVLSGFAQCLRTRLRSYDVACRYGGDEFVVILPGCAATGATRLANELLARARALEAVHDLPVAVTISIGVASARGSSIDAERLLALADENLLQAKRHGRNCALAASRPPRISRIPTSLTAGAPQLPCSVPAESASAASGS